MLLLFVSGESETTDDDAKNELLIEYCDVSKGSAAGECYHIIYHTRRQIAVCNIISCAMCNGNDT
jgi:hypothetical protein